MILAGCKTIPVAPDYPYYITNDPADIGKQKIDCCSEVGYKPESIDWKD